MYLGQLFCMCFIILMANMIECGLIYSRNLPDQDNDYEIRSPQRKRPFCNAFAGCGRKRSDTSISNDEKSIIDQLQSFDNDKQQRQQQQQQQQQQQDSDSSFDDTLGDLLDLNSEPAVEDLMRQIMSQAKLWEAIQEANQEMNIQKNDRATAMSAGGSIGGGGSGSGGGAAGEYGGGSNSGGGRSGSRRIATIAFNSQ